VSHERVVVRVGIAGGDGTVRDAASGCVPCALPSTCICPGFPLTCMPSFCRPFAHRRVSPLFPHCLLIPDSTVLCRYYAALLSRPELMARANVQFYLIPVGATNTLADFVTAFDGWFGRVRHLLSCVPLVLPSVGTSSGEETIVDAAVRRFLEKTPIPKPGRDIKVSLPANGVPTPPTVLRLAIQEQFRSSDSVFPVVIYECEVWPTSKGGGSAGPPSNSISFVTYVEVGVHAAAARYAEANIKV
jgi:hypothetical protein